MICRVWHGWTTAGDADVYVYVYESYLRERASLR